MSKEFEQEPKVVYNDSFVLVVNKPVGLVSVRADTVKEPTLQDWLETETGAFPPSAGSMRGRNSIWKGDAAEEFFKRSGMVHRLDKETSGLVIVSKNIGSYTFLKQQFRERKVRKEYLALAYGAVARKGVLRKPVGRSKFNPQKMAIRRGGKKSVTYWRRIALFADLEEAKRCLQVDYYGLRLTTRAGSDVGEFSFLKLFPKTGRTHQIRVHLVSINHPVVGDPDYSGRRRFARDADVFGRMMLHAQSVGFVHPETKAWMQIVC